MTAKFILSSQPIQALCLTFANTAQSFALTQKIVAAKEPIFAAKAQFARDVKVKVAEVANKVGFVMIDVYFIQ